MQKLKTETGIEHGLIRTVANAVKEEDGFKNMKPELKAQCLKQKKEDSRIVKVIYQNRVESNGVLDTTYCEYAGDPIQFYKFLDGREYEIPLGLVKKINSISIPVRSEILDKNGVPTVRDGQSRKEHQFISSSF
jgi:hypothetical protein